MKHVKQWPHRYKEQLDYKDRKGNPKDKGQRVMHRGTKDEWKCYENKSGLYERTSDEES